MDVIVSEIGRLADELASHPASDIEYWFSKRLKASEKEKNGIKDS